MGEFTKSLLANQVDAYRYGVGLAQVWGSFNEKSETKYVVERVLASFAIKICKVALLIIVLIFTWAKWSRKEMFHGKVT